MWRWGIAEPIAKANPGNLFVLRELSLSQRKIGDVLQYQGNLPAALESYRASLANAERLAKSDPRNFVWQHDLARSHQRVGDVLWSQDNLPAALESYLASLAIFERLARSDPGIARWQHDVALSHLGVGDVLWAQGKRARGGGELPGLARHCRACGQVRPWQCRLAAHPQLVAG